MHLEKNKSPNICSTSNHVRIIDFQGVEGMSASKLSIPSRETQNCLEANR